MLQQPEPDDYVIATGEQHSVREFVEAAFAEVGITIGWDGTGVDEIGVVQAVDSTLLAQACNGYGPVGRSRSGGDGAVKPGQVLVRIDKRYFRPTEVLSLLGDASKARAAFGWEPTTLFAELVHEMVWADLVEAQKFDCIRESGLPIVHRHDS
jgi:GDPmannose 4,6-dehydratase